MSAVAWRLGELLRIREEEAWTDYRVAASNIAGLKLVTPVGARECWMSFEQLRNCWIARNLRRERAVRDGTTDVAKRMLGADLGSRPEAERAHVRWFAPYVIAFSKSGMTRHSSQRELTTLIERVSTECGHSNKPHWRTLSNHLKTWKSGLCDGRSFASMVSARGNRQKRFKDFEGRFTEILQKMVFVKNRRSSKEVLSTLRAELEAYNLAAAPSDRVTFKICERTVERRIATYSQELKTKAWEGGQSTSMHCTIVGVAPVASRPLQIDHQTMDVYVINPKTG